MPRIIVYVDGFNLYHGLKQLGHDSGRSHSFLWLDISSCIKSILRDPSFNFTSIKYFTAKPFGNDTCKRHQTYCAALKHSGVQLFYGKYKHKRMRCNLCNGTFQTYEEKQTDINIALHILNDAVQGNYDTAVLVSGDTDLVSAIKFVKMLYAQKKFIVIFPPNRNRAFELSSVADKSYVLDKGRCRTNQFPDKITDDIQKPETWY